MSWQPWERAFLDSICVASVIGIWPRFLEPRWIRISKHDLFLPGWKGPSLRIAQLSDLHWGPLAAHKVLRRQIQRIQNWNPDLVFWTGDFLVDGSTHDFEGLFEVLTSVRGRFGEFACLGNHDYQDYASRDGSHSQLEGGALGRIWRRLREGALKMDSKTLSDRHEALEQTLLKSGIRLLHNSMEAVEMGNFSCKIAGCGELWAGHAHMHGEHCDFLLAHNPDALLDLSVHWKMAFSGHTHGRQINLPWIGHRLAQSCSGWTRGFYQYRQQPLYVSRGLNTTLPFRLGSPPEITLFSLMGS